MFREGCVIRMVFCGERAALGAAFVFVLLASVAAPNITGSEGGIAFADPRRADVGSECSLLQTMAVTARVSGPTFDDEAAARAQDSRRARDAIHADTSGQEASKRLAEKWAHLWDAALLIGQVGIIIAFGILLGARLVSPIFWPVASPSKPAQQHDTSSSGADTARHFVEIKIGGMTCSACSSTVEKFLLSEKGVLSATVNLVVEKATVVFDATMTTAVAICDSVEDVGFEGTILHQGPATEVQDGQATLHLQLKAGQVETLEKFVAGIDGVISLQRLDKTMVRVTYRPTILGARVLMTKFQEELPDAAVQCAPPQEGSQIADLQRAAEKLLFNFTGSALPAAMVFAITMILPAYAIELGTIPCGRFHLHVATLLVVALATPVQFVFGADFHFQARKAIMRKAPNMDVLVSLATSISFGYATLVLVSLTCKALRHHDGELDGLHHSGGVLVGLSCHALHFFGMAPILMAVVLCGKYMETTAKIQTMESLVRLMECKSHTAQLVSGDKEQAVNVELVQLGDTLRFYEGSHIPVDGILTSESTVWVSEAILTGESAPVEKIKGSILLGGTTVSSGSGFMVATAVGSKTALGEIMTLISNAQATKTKTQQLANTVAGFFVVAVMAASLAVFAVWLWLAETHRVTLPKEFDPNSSFDTGLFAARFGVAVLMVACPCAMGLATPTAVMVSTGVAAQLGCLVKSAAALEEGCKVDTIVLDKTGTITEGAPRVGSAALCVTALEQLPQLPAMIFQGASVLPHAVHVDLDASIPHLSTQQAQELERSFWWLVGAAEKGSDHPIAKCLLEAAHSAVGSSTFATPDEFRYKVGRGVSAVFGAVDVRVGSFSFLEDTARELQCPCGEDAHSQLVKEWSASRRAAKDTVVVVHAVVRRKLLLLGAVAVRDAVRADAAATVHYFQQRGIDVWMCTGDCCSTALAIAKEVGISEDHVVAEALPKQKADKVAALKAKATGSVLFIGDGVNDAPALASADVGVAIGVGARLALDAADVVLVRSELMLLAAYLKLSQETVFTIRRNYAWAFVFNVIGLPAAAGIMYPRIVLAPLVAGLAMGLSSTIVVSSSLMLRYFVPPKIAEPKLGQTVTK